MEKMIFLTLTAQQNVLLLQKLLRKMHFFNIQQSEYLCNARAEIHQVTGT
jgi:hypothetical protein